MLSDELKKDIENNGKTIQLGYGEFIQANVKYMGRKPSCYLYYQTKEFPFILELKNYITYVRELLKPDDDIEKYNVALSLSVITFVTDAQLDFNKIPYKIHDAYVPKLCVLFDIIMLSSKSDYIETETTEPTDLLPKYNKILT